MRLFVVALGMLGATLNAAHARNYPWCLQSDAFEGAQNCAYTTLQQCLFDRQGLGGFCNQNPTYVLPPPSTGKRREVAN